VDIFLDPAGNDQNTGGSLDPVLTLGRALELVPRISPTPYTIKVAAGTYAGVGNRNLQKTVIGERLTITGPGVFDVENSGFGIFFEGCSLVFITGLTWRNGADARMVWPVRGSRLIVNNVTVENAMTGFEVSHGSHVVATSCRVTNLTNAGLVGEFGSFLDVRDCTIENASKGVLYTKHGEGQVRGGSIMGCDQGIELNYGSYCWVGGSVNGTGALSVSDCDTALYVTRNSQVAGRNDDVAYQTNTADKVIDAGAFAVDAMT
jgi:hypothetical protein